MVAIVMAAVVAVPSDTVPGEEGPPPSTFPHSFDRRLPFSERRLVAIVIAAVVAVPNDVGDVDPSEEEWKYADFFFLVLAAPMPSVFSAAVVACWFDMRGVGAATSMAATFGRRRRPDAASVILSDACN